MIGNLLSMFQRNRIARDQAADLRAAEQPVAWRIVVDGDKIVWVTDGRIAIECDGQIDALQALARYATVWPKGTSRPTAAEVTEARHKGLTRGATIGYCAGLLFGLAAQALAWAMWS